MSAEPIFPFDDGLPLGDSEGVTIGGEADAELALEQLAELEARPDGRPLQRSFASAQAMNDWADSALRRLEALIRRHPPVAPPPSVDKREVKIQLRPADDLTQWSEAHEAAAALIDPGTGDIAPGVRLVRHLDNPEPQP